MRVFVTGAGGFIASHLCEALRDAGHDVTAMAHARAQDSFGWLDGVRDVAKCRGDVRDAEQMRALVRGHEAVFHLAALVSVPDSYERPRSYVETNVTGTLNVLMACREAGARLIHTSTSEVYGTAQYTPMDESHAIHPQSPYAASKVAADALVRSFALSYGLPCVTLRPFNAFGPRQSERAVIARIVSQALNPDTDTVALGNLSARRDFTFVTDTAAAFLAALQLERGTYNVGTGSCVAIGEVANMVLDLPGLGVLPGRLRKIVKRDIGRDRPEASEVHELKADARAFRDLTGWAPKVELRRGLACTMAWRAGHAGYSPDLELVA